MNKENGSQNLFLESLKTKSQELRKEIAIFEEYQVATLMKQSKNFLALIRAGHSANKMLNNFRIIEEELNVKAIVKQKKILELRKIIDNGKAKLLGDEYNEINDLVTSIRVTPFEELTGIVPEVIELMEVIKKETSAGNSTRTKRSSYTGLEKTALLPHLSVVFGHVLLVVLLLVTISGLETYGVYTAMRVIIVLCNIIMFTVLFLSVNNDRFYAKEESTPLLWIVGIYYLFNIFVFTFASMDRTGWIVLDVTFVIGYAVTAVLYIIYKPIIVESGYNK